PGWRPTTPRHGCRGRSMQRFPVFEADRLERLVVAEHGAAQGAEGFCGIVDEGHDLQDGLAVVGDDQLLAGALHLPEVLEGLGLEERFRDELIHVTLPRSVATMVPIP